MTPEAKKTSGIIILTVPSIIYGGYFLLSVLSGQQNQLELTDFQKSMFRAGHAHAGVLVIFALIAQIFTDYATLSSPIKWMVRVAFPLSAILVSLGFFAGAIGKNIVQPTDLIGILYTGMAILTLALATLGLGLVRGKS